MIRTLTQLANLFPVWVLTASVVALFYPPAFTWFNEISILGQPLIVWGLGIIMLGMGITLSIDDFRSVLKMPRSVATGLLAQFLIMPTLGWSIAHLLKLPTPLAVGLILVSCCPGGTASNVVSYIARANVALSVLMTMCSTFAAIILTPLLTRLLAGTYVQVDAWGLFNSTLQIVLLPLVAGLLMHHVTPRLVGAVLPVAPLVAVLTIALICAAIIGQNAAAVRTSGGTLLLAIGMLHIGGFALGYTFGAVFGYGEIIRRTISIEVGMQNSGLGTALARRHFPDPLTAVPCAISAVFHSILGSLLAGIWRVRVPDPNKLKLPQELSRLRPVLVVEQELSDSQSSDA
ncbi:MAG: bile acid:sodium symporter family protein [Acidobacteriota bacterium]